MLRGTVLPLDADHALTRSGHLRTVLMLGFVSSVFCTSAHRNAAAQESNPATLTLAEGRFDQALDVRNGGIVVPALEGYGQLPITVEVWVRIENADQDHAVLVNDASNSGSRWALLIEKHSKLPILQIVGGAAARVSATTPVEIGRWHHIAAILEPTRCRLILDGRIVADQNRQPNRIPPQRSGLGIGTSVDNRTGSPMQLDDVRISSGVREILIPPTAALVSDEQTISRWSFDEPEAEYLARWTPGGETNQRGLPYAHRIADYEFDKDPAWVDGRWQQTDKGLSLRHSTEIPDRQTSPKNMVVFTNPQHDHAVMFDLQRCGVMAVVSKPELTTDPARFGLLRRPVLNGDLWFSVPPGKLWREDAAERTALAESDLDFKGHRVRGNFVIPEYTVVGGQIQEVCATAGTSDNPIVSRVLQFAGLTRSVQHTLAEMPADVVIRRSGIISTATCEFDGQMCAIVVIGQSTSLAGVQRDVVLRLPADTSETVRVIYFRGPRDTLSTFEAFANAMSRLPDPSLLFEEAPQTQWGSPLTVASSVAQNPTDAPWVIDTIGIPFDNPYKALFFITAIDFFSDGSAAVTTAHGDVWLVRGLNESLQHVTWHRFATGLYQPMGIEIVDDKIIVLGRDELTRLHDTNGDGEADWYESFNNDVVISGRDHAYAMRLERDPRGNFYFVKSGTEPHGSALLKVAADGSSLNVYATGFRHPYGMGTGPNGEITVADNEGDWVPSSKIDLIREGGFYGYYGARKEAPDNRRPDPPLCYIPKVADNSCGGQVWLTSDRWGNYHQNEMLHLSWGRCTLHAVLRETIDGVSQAATVRFPDLTFLSGSGDAEFSPTDGQLYVVGLNGWQTGAIQDGCLQRVRYTGQPIRMPERFEVLNDGIRVTFSCPLHPDSASQITSFLAEQWNYRWKAMYGSFHYSVSEPERIGHDTVVISQAEVSEDRRSVMLTIPDLQTVDQFHLRTQLLSADGHRLDFDLYSTIKAKKHTE